MGFRLSQSSRRLTAVSPLRENSSAEKLSLRMPHTCHHLVAVYGPPRGDRVRLSADGSFDVSVLWRGQRVNMTRNLTETIDKTLSRLCTTLSKKCAKPEGKKRTRKQRDGLVKEAEQSAEDLNDRNPLLLTEDGICLCRADGEKVSGVPCGLAFSDATTLNITTAAEGTDKLAVIWNPLKVENVSFLGFSPIAGLPTLLQYSVIYPHDTLAALTMWWEVTDEKVAAPCTAFGPFALPCTPADVGSALRPTLTELEIDGKWLRLRLVHVGPAFTPDDSHVGKRLYASVSDPEYRCLGTGVMLPKTEPRRPLSWRDDRLVAFRKSRRPAEDDDFSFTFRVGSFNLLAPDYARTPLATVSFFPYCTAELLSLEFRLPRLCSELTEMDCDIIGVQECSEQLYHEVFVFYLQDRYASHLSLKTGNVSEGVAIFYDRKRFREVGIHSFDFRSGFLADDAGIPHSNLVQSIRQRWPQFFSDVLPQLTTVFQIVALEPVLGSSSTTSGGSGASEKTSSSSRSLLLVTNTHLFYHPMAGHIRTLQAFLLLHRVAELRQIYTDQGWSVSVVCLGDYNSLLESGTYGFITRREVPAFHRDWNLFDQFSFQSEPDVAPNPVKANNELDNSSETTPLPAESTQRLEVTYPSQFPALYDAYAGETDRLTNVVNGFQGTLDYIFVSAETLWVDRVLPSVPDAQLTSHIGLPSPVYPSDHIAIAAELTLTSLPSVGESS